jgi:hypothetical protein
LTRAFHSGRAATLAAAGGIVALLSLLLVVHVPSHHAWQRVLFDASHGPIFAAVAVIIAAWWSGRRPRRPGESGPRWAIAARAFAVAVAIGVAIEGLQWFQRRPPSLFDVLTDAAGAAAGLALWLLWSRRRAEDGSDDERRGAVTALLVATAVAAGAFVLWRPLGAALAYGQRAADFPVIARFESSRDLYLVAVDGATTGIVELPHPWQRRPGERALRLGFDARHRAAVQLLEPSPDWSGHSVLAVDLTNPGDEELALTLRILDAAHDWTYGDRLNLPLLLPPRTRITLRVSLGAVAAAPATRRLDLTRVGNVMLFGRKPESPGELYVSRIWLE